MAVKRSKRRKVGSWDSGRCEDGELGGGGGGGGGQENRYSDVKTV